ncbi:cytochrome P450 [Palleronia sp. KMU-117]|uniref:cytochrome P450 n=1 Tax=Palleronia sp. KMU-117 TaxID=3434108 RepID=UPI003D74D6B3
MKPIRQSPTDPSFVQDPYPFYDRARALGDIVLWEDYDLPVATTYEAVNTILRHRKMGREVPPEMRPPVPAHLAAFHAIEDHSMLERDGEDHRRLRTLVLRAFTSRSIQCMAPEISQLADTCIGNFPDGPFDLLPALAQELPVKVIARLLGVPDTMSAQLLSWSNAMVAMYQARRGPGIEAAANAAAADFAAFIREFVDLRRRRPASDLITDLINAEEQGGRLSTDELIATCILLLNAGHEATVHTIGNSVRTILKTGVDCTALRPAFIAATVEELLRFDPPLHLFSRYVYEPMELFGHRFKRGDRIGCLLASANRDRKVWPDADVFDPTRPQVTNMSLGAGVHFCIGAPLARLELQIVLPLLFARCPDLALADEPAYANLYHFHGLQSLMVECTCIRPAAPSST